MNNPVQKVKSNVIALPKPKPKLFGFLGDWRKSNAFRESTSVQRDVIDQIRQRMTTDDHEERVILTEGITVTVKPGSTYQTWRELAYACGKDVTPEMAKKAAMYWKKRHFLDIEECHIENGQITTAPKKNIRKVMLFTALLEECDVEAATRCWA